MAKRLCSVGLDVGTTTTQMVVSQLTVENRANGFAVPDMEIADREIVYRSPIHFTPLLGKDRVDGTKLRTLVMEEYQKAGITPEQVDTGAVIVTGETSRKENARSVLDALSDFAGDFVVATAGPDLESVLSAKGAGATAYSAQTGKAVLHMDIGGGTSNLSWISDGKIVATGCLNVGGRLMKRDEAGAITYLSPVLEGLTDLRLGDIPDERQVQQLAQLLTQGLEMAAGLREITPLLEKLQTQESGKPWQPPGEPVVLSFSGGVADCIDTRQPDLAFGDMGPALGQAIRQSRLCAGAYRLGGETIRATVIGAGSHSAQLSGSTVFYRNISFPMKNLPVAVCSREEQQDSKAIAEKLSAFEAPFVVLAMPGLPAPEYEAVRAMAEAVAKGVGDRPALLCLQEDMAKALGHALCLLLPENRPCLCIDRVALQSDSFLDVGEPVGPALPVVVKTLILSH